MTNESISKRLTKLFELQKSGAITKEEFDKLKKQVLSEDEGSNVELERTMEPGNAKLPDKPNQVKKGNRIWIFAMIGIVIIVAAFFIIKTAVFSTNLPDSYKIKNKTIQAKLLPIPGLYIFNNGRGYQEFINVIANDGVMTFQKGERENNLENQEVSYVEEKDGLISFGVGWDIKYIGDGVIKEYIYGATSEPGEGINYIKKLQPGEKSEKGTSNQSDILKDKNPNSYLITVLSLYKKQDSQITKIIHPDIGVYMLTNPGSRCISSNSKMIKFVGLSIPEKNVFDKEPKGDMCAGYPGEKDGFYYQSISKEKLPSYADYENDSEVFKDVELPNKYSNSQIIKVTIIQNESWEATFYFAQIDSIWYLFCQSFCGCSA